MPEEEIPEVRLLAVNSQAPGQGGKGGDDERQPGEAHEIAPAPLPDKIGAHGQGWYDQGQKALDQEGETATDTGRDQEPPPTGRAMFGLAGQKETDHGQGESGGEHGIQDAEGADYRHLKTGEKDQGGDWPGPDLIAGAGLADQQHDQQGAETDTQG